MEQEKYEVIINQRSIIGIAKFTDYISENGYPQIAKKLFDEYIDKCSELETFPLRYELCKYKYKNYHYFSYESLVFVYRVIAKTVEIINVLHAKTYI